MSELPILIASRAAIIMIAAIAAILTAMSIVEAFRKRPSHPGDILGRTVAATIVFAIPVGISAVAGAIGSAVLLGVGAPPMTYGFIALVALVSFRAAVKHPGRGMDGCTKLFGLIASGYALVWCAVSFIAVGGMDSLESDALSLRWVQPLLAALPFALLHLKLTNARKRTLWLLLGSWAFIAAVMALCFFPIESGFGQGWLPRSDWLRFPLTGLAIIAILSLIRLAFYWRLKPSIRRTRIRDWRSTSLLLAAIMASFGLSWAIARALIDALV